MGGAVVIALTAAIAGGLTIASVLVLGAASRPDPTRRAARERAAAVEPPEALVTPARSTPRWVLVAIAALVVTTGIAVAGAAATIVLVAAAVALWRRRHRTSRLLEARRIDAALPDATELFVLCIHAGRSPTQAVAELARRAPPAVRPAFAEVELQLHRGRGLADALGELPRLLGAPASLLASAVATADREGLPLAPMLDRLAEDARAARRRVGEAEARRLPIRLAFPLVLCTLPAFVLLAIAPAVLGALSTLRGTAP